MRLAQEENADYIFGKTLSFGPEPLTDEKSQIRQEAPTERAILRDPLSYAIRDYNHVPSTALIRRSAIPLGLHLNENFISCQDLALALPIFERGRVMRLDCAVCHQLIGSAKRLSAHEALTYQQTIEIIKDFGKKKFDDRYQYMASRKIVSRAMRWMRRHKMIKQSPLLYLQLSMLYCTLLAKHPKSWEHYLDRAAETYLPLIPSSRRIY
jgi:hypothetical protein